MSSFRRWKWGKILAVVAVSGCQVTADPRTSASATLASSPTASEPPTRPATTLTQRPPPTQPAAIPTPRPSPTPMPGCIEQTGRVLEQRYPAVATAGEVPLLVYLPPCYAETGAGYPTVYLLHGLPFDERHWLNLGVVERVEAGIVRGEWPAMILVMPYQPEPLFSSTDGGPGSYEQEFLEGLLAYVEHSYLADPARRGLAGISRGGVWALEIGFRNPQAIEALAALSPALAVNSARPAYDPLELARSAAQLPPSILLLAGSTDWAAVMTADLSQILSERQIPHQYTVVVGDHSDPTWAGGLGELFDFMSETLGRP